MQDALDRQRAEQAAEGPPGGGETDIYEIRHQIRMAGRAEATAALDRFAARHAKTYPKVAECLTKDRETLLAFYDFPAKHWVHLRTTNPVEGVFATVRHRTVRTKGCLSHGTGMVMVFKPVTAASRTWRKLKGSNQLPKMIESVKFTDGIEVTDQHQNAAAWPPITQIRA